MGNRNVEAAVDKVGEKLPYNYHMTMGEVDEIMRVASRWAGGQADLLSVINTAFKFGVAVGSRAHKAGRIPAL